MEAKTNLKFFYLPYINRFYNFPIFGNDPVSASDIIRRISRKLAKLPAYQVPPGFVPFYFKLDALRRDFPSASYITFLDILFVPQVVLPWRAGLYPLDAVGFLPVFGSLRELCRHLSSGLKEPEHFTMQCQVLGDCTEHDFQSIRRCLALSEQLIKHPEFWAN